MPRSFITDNVNTAKASATKPGASFLSDNNNTAKPTVWKEATNITDTTADRLSSIWAPACPIPTATFTASQTTGGWPLTVTFTDTSDNDPTSWLWDFDDGSTSTSQNPTHVFESEGVFEVTLTASNDCGSRTSSATTITIDVQAPVVLFDDTFTGTAGTSLTVHTPDVAPTGFVYRADLGPAQLDGSGQVGGSGTLDANFDSTSSSPAFSLSLAFPYTIEITATGFVVGVQERASFRLTQSAGNYVEVSVGTNSGGTQTASAEVSNGTSASVTQSFGSATEHTVLVRCSAASSEAFIDGVSAGTIARVGPLNISLLELKLAREAGGRTTANRIRVIQEFL